MFPQPWESKDIIAQQCQPVLMSRGRTVHFQRAIGLSSRLPASRLAESLIAFILPHLIKEFGAGHFVPLSESSDVTSLRTWVQRLR
jgi:hypothetical protein